MSIQQRIRAAFRGIRTGDAGLSMAEILVALMVFSILATCVAYSLTTTLIQTQHTRARATALSLATQDLDSLRMRALNTKDGILQVTSTATPTYQTVGGTTFALSRVVNWADTTGKLGACGTGTGTLAYKSVVDTVSWRINSNSDLQKVTMATSIAPISNLNSDTTGTIIVSIIGADGSAEQGVTVTMTPVSGGATALTTPPSATDSDGCSFGLKASPGTYKVTATRAGGIDFKQQDPSVNGNVVIKAGQNTMVNFSYDDAAIFPLTYPAAVTSDMALSFVNPTSGVSTFTGAPTSVKAYPWPDGYGVVAGAYVPGTGSASCLSPYPGAWQTPDTDGAIGVAPTPVATQPGATAPATSVPMSTVTITGLSGGGDYITAVTAASSGKGDPGCQAKQTLAFPTAFKSSATIALPYGTWSIYSGNSKGDLKKNIFSLGSLGTNITITGRGQVNPGLLYPLFPNTVTLDPRQVVS